MDNLVVTPLTKDLAELYSNEIIAIIKSMADYQYWEKEHLLSEREMKWNFSQIVLNNRILVGFIISSLKENNTAHIHKYAIKEEYRSIGIGRKMQDEFISNLKVNYPKIEQVTLNIYKENTRGIQFHIKNGLAVISQRETDLGCLILMKLDL